MRYSKNMMIHVLIFRADGILSVFKEFSWSYDSLIEKTICMVKEPFKALWYYEHERRNCEHKWLSCKWRFFLYRAIFIRRVELCSYYQVKLIDEGCTRNLKYSMITQSVSCQMNCNKPCITVLYYDFTTLYRWKQLYKVLAHNLNLLQVLNRPHCMSAVWHLFV